MKMQIKQNCKFFKPDSPCVYHKIDGRKCSECDSFIKTKGHILIIKKDAAGDVLRTTAILEPLKRKFANYKIIWFVAEKNRDVLSGNLLIDEIWTDTPENIQAISLLEFDVVINLDLLPESLILATIANGKLFYGFKYQKNWKIQCSNKTAEEWFLMSHNDQIKKQNRKTYQKIIADIIELDNYGEIIVPLQKPAIEKARKFAEKYNLSGKKIIGIHTGSGSRWQTKRWPEKNIKKLIKILTQEKYTVLLFGGEEEKDIMENLIEKNNKYLINTGWNNSIPEFFALLDLCDLVVCADTLAMHAVTGLKKRVIALFGPTSSYEIDDYGRMEKIITPMECFCCYKRECGRRPSCMEMISYETVYSLIKKLL